MNTTQSLIVYLFVKSEPVAYKELQSSFGMQEDELKSAIRDSSAMLASLFLTVVDDGKSVELRTAPSASTLVEKIRKDEFSRDIGKAGIETLSIVLYRGPSSRSEIDFIRGVNSSHILRSLSMRGLLRRVSHPKDERSFLYEPTTELLSHLGVRTLQELPEYESVVAEMSALEERAHETNAGETPPHI